MTSEELSRLTQAMAKAEEEGTESIYALDDFVSHNELRFTEARRRRAPERFRVEAQG